MTLHNRGDLPSVQVLSASAGAGHGGNGTRVMRKCAVDPRVTRFFWIPRGVRRQPPTPVRRLVGLWLAMLALGAGFTAFGWDDELGGSHPMVVMLLFHVVDDIIEGVRHRWPAALAAVALLWGAGRLTNTVLPDSLDAPWAATIAAAVGTTLGMAVAATITRFPERRLRRPVKGHDSRFDGGAPSR